ncbi:hypothetical protein Ancab_030238, partial [Ancistrocladus abbreviatus]
RMKMGSEENSTEKGNETHFPCLGFQLLLSFEGKLSKIISLSLDFDAAPTKRQARTETRTEHNRAEQKERTRSLGLKRGLIVILKCSPELKGLMSLPWELHRRTFLEFKSTMHGYGYGDMDTTRYGHGDTAILKKLGHGHDLDTA